ncbi:MAG: glycosyltransferase family 2 protein [Nitrospirota bacterium]|nr:glycosyltransferase family 2 protein [Nitrospirota bacterium]
MNTYQITAVMPSLNEEKNLSSAVQNVLDSYQRLGIKGEVLIVNDGSTDGTGRLAEEFKHKDPSIQVIHHAAPQGIGGSFWDGVKAARGEVVVMIPGDGENDAAEILRYLPLMEQVDMVVPYVFNRQVRSWFRRKLSNLYRGIINITFGTTLNYMNGTVLYRKCILDDIELKARGFFYQTELLIKCIRRGYLYAEVPYALLQRAAGRSKATSLRSLKNVMQAYLTLLLEIHIARPSHTAPAVDSRTAARWKGLQA